MLHDQMWLEHPGICFLSLPLPHLHLITTINNLYSEKTPTCSASRAPAGIIGLGAAVKYLQGIGFEEIQRQDLLLNRYITDQLREIPRLRLIVMNRCLNDPVTKNAVDWQMEEVLKTEFFGTPTVFIGNQAFVGPKPYRVYAISQNGLLYWLK